MVEKEKFNATTYSNCSVVKGFSELAAK